MRLPAANQERRREREYLPFVSRHQPTQRVARRWPGLASCGTAGVERAVLGVQWLGHEGEGERRVVAHASEQLQKVHATRGR